MFTTDKGISYEHFTPLYQNLAQIIRLNVFPTQNAGKLMSFVEMKLMYKLAFKKIDFNLPYMIMTKMISAAKLGYMPYGLLLTQVFEHFLFDINIPPFFYVKNTILDKAHRDPLPLPELHVMNVPTLSAPLPTSVPAEFAANVAVPAVESVTTAIPTSTVSHGQLTAYFSVPVKLSSKVELENGFKVLKAKFDHFLKYMDFY